MYLYGKQYLWSATGMEPGPVIIEKIRALFPEVKAQPCRIEFELGYWRKANAIHKWFVDNVQDGVDDCGTYHVGKDDLLKLRFECELALGCKGEGCSALPPTAGFFFGSTAKDEYYYDDIKRTLEIIKLAIDFAEKHGSVTYHSSW